LKLSNKISSIIPVQIILPAVGQGALGIEIRKDNKLAEETLQSIHDENTYAAAIAERTFLKVLEGGCQVPIGAYAEVKPNGLYLDGLVGALDGSITFRSKVRGSKFNPETLGAQLAKAMIKAGAGKVLQEIYKHSRLVK
jgi:hydroxymethylbilane synthase